MKRVFVTFVVVVIVFAVMVGCTSTGQPTGSSDSGTSANTPAASEPTTGESSTGPIVIGVSMDTVDHPFWQADVAGMEAKAEELGVTLDLQVAQGDAAVQNQQIDDMLAKGVAAIICAPKDSKAILPAITKCNEKNVPFIYNDRSIDNTDTATVAYGCGTDNYALAKSGWEWMVQYVKDNDIGVLNVLELSGDLADNNVLDRTQGFKDVMDANPDIVNLVQTVPTEWDMDKSLA